MSTLTEIAQQLKDSRENIILIYAFNSTGKTRLCVEFKEITKNPQNGKHAGVYYNAFSEDLFVWDNDEEHHNENLKLQIVFSSLNQFHSFLIENPDLLKEKLALYKPKYFFKFNSNANPERGIDSITFFLEGDDKPIKISRGEERIFIWCFFLALFEVTAGTGEQDDHFFIDDPVSSLDEYNMFITADSIFDLIEVKLSDLHKKIILTTHHIGLFSILADRLTRGEKSGRYKNLTKLFVLSKHDNDFSLNTPNNDVFLFHLHLMQTLQNAIDEKLFSYHFVLMRQLLETISSFLGKSGIGYALSQLDLDNTEELGNTINYLSHKNAYRLQFNEMSPNEVEIFKNVFLRIQNKYNFKF